MPPARHFVYNTRIITSERHLLNIEIIDLLGKGIIVPSVVEDNEFLSPIFTVSKHEGEFRMILNLKDLSHTGTLRWKTSPQYSKTLQKIVLWPP